MYLLCKNLSTLGLAEPTGRDLFVVFISNEKEQVPLWCQKASKRMDGLVIWDYHVICIQTQRNGETSTHDLVWDLDSTLPFPSPLNRYCMEGFQQFSQLNLTFNRLFRVIHAPLFLCSFASDRSHMKDSHGNWYSLPPKYEPIVAEDGAVNNFDKYLRMTAGDITTDMEALIDAVYSNKFGVVMNEPMLESFFAQIHLLPRVT